LPARLVVGACGRSADSLEGDVTDADAIATALDQFAPSEEETETVQRLYELLPDAMPQSFRVVEALFGVLERFPDAEFGAPGPIVHAIESIADYEAQLRSSLARMPTTYPVWMCNRVLNAATDAQQEAEWMAALEVAATHPRATEAARVDALEFLAFQREGESK
jgi:hypothetical protein